MGALEVEVSALKTMMPEVRSLVARQAVKIMERFMAVEAMPSKTQARKQHVINLKAMRKKK